jgi:hypothetical protein
MAMKREIQDSSDKKIKQMTEELLMPAGEFGAALFAAILVLIFFWEMPNFTNSTYILAPAANSAHLSTWLHPSDTDSHHAGTRQLN